MRPGAKQTRLSTACSSSGAGASGPGSIGRVRSRGEVTSRSAGPPGAGGAAPTRGRAHEPADRRAPRCQRAHRPSSRHQHPAQARSPLAHGRGRYAVRSGPLGVAPGPGQWGGPIDGRFGRSHGLIAGVRDRHESPHHVRGCGARQDSKEEDGHDNAARATESKARSPGQWALGDYHRFATETVWEVGPSWCAACGISPGHRVLDVAAGTGNVAIRAAEAGRRSWPRT